MISRTRSRFRAGKRADRMTTTVERVATYGDIQTIYCWRYPPSSLPPNKAEVELNSVAIWRWLFFIFSIFSPCHDSQYAVAHFLFSSNFLFLVAFFQVITCVRSTITHAIWVVWPCVVVVTERVTFLEVGRKIRIQINHNKWEEVEKNERSVFYIIQSRDRIITPLTEPITK